MSEKKSEPKMGLAALAALKDALPPGPMQGAKVERPAPREIDPFAGKIVIAKSRKGRGGKTVTTIVGIAGPLEPLARELKHALGCGAVVEERAIVVQGEQEERVRAFLVARGAHCVVIGN